MATLSYATDPRTRDQLGRRARKGELHRIRRGIYADSHDPDEIAETLDAAWVDVAAYLFDDPVAVFRTAVELKPARGHVYLAVPGAARRTVTVGPLRFMVDDGVVDQGVEPFHPKMQRSTPARQLLDNLVPSRAKAGIRKTLGRDWVEAQLVQAVERRGETGLNRLCDAARALAPTLGLDAQFEELNRMISAVLQTHPAAGTLRTAAAIFHVSGQPVDTMRLERFHALARYLRQLDMPALPYQYHKTTWRHLAFFESYFSNYIEGTRFTIDEAEEIAASGRAVGNRHEASHDILSHIEVSGDATEMHRVPRSGPELLNILKSRHRILMAQRPDKCPGQFKDKPNQAGATLFVDPENLEGTLIQGYGIYKDLAGGLQKALFIHFLVAECHPFDDGNGRIARIMMNAELVSGDQYKIIVPSVCRDNYLGGLRQASRHDTFRTMIKVLHQLQQYTASINWFDYNEVRHTLETDAADQDPDDGLMTFNRTLRQFIHDYPPG